MDLDEAFAGVEKLLYKLAWKCAQRYNIPFEDCRSEAYYAFVKAFNWRFDPNKKGASSFSSKCYEIATFRLRTMVINRTKAIPMSELNEETAGHAPEQRSESMEMIEDLSHDAQEIIALIVDTPQHLLGWDPHSPRQLLAKVKRYLIEHKGRRKKDVEKAHEEICIRFQEAWA